MVKSNTVNYIVCTAIKRLETTTLNSFRLKDMFSKDEWSSFGSHVLNAGKMFKQHIGNGLMLQNGKRITFCRIKTNNHNIYNIF